MDPLKAEYLRRIGIVAFVPRAAAAPAEALPPTVTPTVASAPATAACPAPQDGPALQAGTSPMAPGAPAGRQGAAATHGGTARVLAAVDGPGPVMPSSPRNPLDVREGAPGATDATLPVELPPAGDLLALEACVARCRACGLHRGRSRSVFGSGPVGARWMIVGEGPGAEEDHQGLPFVGRAGQLLTRMIESLGVAREAVYIANTVKCRPPQNRDPAPEEMAACRPFLDRQIAEVRPALILAVGRIAAQSLLGSQEPLARLRGRLHHYPGTQLPLVVTYHPAYLLRSPREKRKAWEDLLYARSQATP